MRGRRRPRPKTRPKRIGQLSLHRYLWSQVNEDRETIVDIQDVADHYRACYETAKTAIHRAREDGRIRLVSWKPKRATVYRVADPEVFKARDPRTHERRRTTPVWG